MPHDDEPQVDHLPRPVVTVAETLVLQPGTGRVLVVRKGAIHAPPGGGVEPGESFAAAAVRETYEETGITVECDGLAVVTERAVGARTELFLLFWARYVSGEPEVVDDGEIDEAQWVTPDEADRLMPWLETSIAALVRERRSIPYFHLVE